MASVVRQEIIVGTIGRVYDKRTVGKDNKSVIDFTIAVTPRRLNHSTNEWEDGKTYWENLTAWERYADNIEKSFNAGDRVIVIGEPDIQEESTYTVQTENGEETRTRAAKRYIKVLYAGHEIGFNAAHSEKEPKKNKEDKDSTTTTTKKVETESTNTKKNNPAPAKTKKVEKEEADDDLNFLSTDDDDDLDFLDDDDLETNTSSTEEDDDPPF